MQNSRLFPSNNICLCKGQNANVKKKSKEDEQTLEELNSAHRCSQAKCDLVQTSHIKQINFSWFCHIINILLTELSRSIWENLDLGRVHRPHCVRSVLTTSVKILPYWPPARLIRAKSIWKKKYSHNFRDHVKKNSLLNVQLSEYEKKVRRCRSWDSKTVFFFGEMFLLTLSGDYSSLLLLAAL